MIEIIKKYFPQLTPKQEEQFAALDALIPRLECKN